MQSEVRKRTVQKSVQSVCNNNRRRSEFSVLYFVNYDEKDMLSLRKMKTEVLSYFSTVVQMSVCCCACLLLQEFSMVTLGLLLKQQMYSFEEGLIFHQNYLLLIASVSNDVTILRGRIYFCKRMSPPILISEGSFLIFFF